MRFVSTTILFLLALSFSVFAQKTDSTVRVTILHVNDVYSSRPLTTALAVDWRGF